MPEAFKTVYLTKQTCKTCGHATQQVDQMSTLFIPLLELDHSADPPPDLTILIKTYFETEVGSDGVVTD